MELSKKALEISPSITLKVTAKAKEMKAQGIDVISFGAGEPDFNTPQNIIEAAVRAMNGGETKYTQTSGINELKDAIINKFRNDNNLEYNRNNIIISTGAKQCLADVFTAILNPNDEVLIPTPYWVSYPELIKLSDGIPVFIECAKENDYKLTVESLNLAVTKRTKAIVINSPNNPSGVVYTEEELKQILEFSIKNDLIIISDEIYEKLIYDNEKHVSIASLSKDAKERTIVINGVSKSYAMTGWRIGYAAADEKIIKLMTNIQSHVTSNPNTIAQYASLEALTGPQDTIRDMIIEFEKRRNYMIEKIERINGVTYIKPRGAFYVMLNIDSFIGKKVNGNQIKGSLDFAEFLLEEEKVAVIPGIAFGLDNYIRLSYAMSLQNIINGIDRIENFIARIS
ncbi:aspartate aminotransferase [Clostridium cavendishii DSM 21758]|uniref:Aminotransferase n=1 Tax=Clostridium cavendishii DSM 21758 TaxID=1121302 RepID=A0A1M6RPX4_9CLOT|nr:pyridoxal phosphate-dependent aminotransferase [Clostridium cavendishii]SHK34561.1 aspartate aminotransferase [Clostridium cavendishii DSM 21758]